jgi:hypothetical protein
MKFHYLKQKYDLKKLIKDGIPILAIMLLMVALIVKTSDKDAPIGVKIFVAAIYGAILFFSVTHINKKTNGNKKLLWFILTALVLNAIFIFPVLKNEGWPSNHEYLGWRSRIVCYIFHFYQYDFLPFWSSGDANGLGSPLPLYYHKIFNYIAGFNYILLGNIKVSIISSIIILNLLGCYGLYRCMRLFYVERISAFCISNTILFLHYTITEWFVRASFAEYAALMVVPWLLWWGIKFLKTGKFSYSIIAILFVLYHSHNIIAYYGIYAITFAVILNLIVTWEKKNTVLILTQSIISAVIFLVIQLVYFYPMYILSDYYNPGKLKLNVNDFFQNFARYCIDTSYLWGKTWEGCTVEIGLLFWLLTLSGIIFLIIKYVRGKKMISNENSPFQIWLVGLFAFYVSLQFRSSLFFYNNVPGADFIQFPWRLNVFIQTIGLLIISFNKMWNRKYLSIGLLSFFVLSYPLLKNLDPGWTWFPKDYLEAKINEGVWGMREYIPNVYPDGNETQSYFKGLLDKGIETQGKCQLTKEMTNNPEQIHITYMVKSETESFVILPYCYSGLEDIFLQKGEIRTKIKPSRTREDPRMQITLPQGEYRLEVYLPHVINIFR